MTDTPRRRPPLPTREGTLKIKPRSTAPADSAPAAKPGRPGDALVFGKESVGLSDELLERFPDRLVGIPTLGAVRSLNLSNSVGIGLFEALRQAGALAPTHLG